eukprot:scaffold128770_cov30-Phaeocystis_antarctica.AAC.1
MMVIISDRGRKIAGSSSEFEFRAALWRWRCDRWRPVTVVVGAAKQQTVTVDPRRSTGPLGPTVHTTGTA